jgi:DNA polymerase-3 subunit epsilon
VGDLIMVFDTETSDKTDFSAPYNDPKQPNLVQLGYKVFTGKRDVIFEVGHLVDTTIFAEWRGINPDAQAVHGISQESLEMYGLSTDMTAQQFNIWAEKCCLFIAHNISFDQMVMQCFAYRSGYSPDIFSTGDVYCTMKSTTNICKIPSPKGYGLKWPKLDEAYKHFVDLKGFKTAHNALSDVNACAEIFWALVDAELVRITGINA